MRLLFVPAVLATALCSAACNSTYLSDDIDVDFNFSLLTGPGDTLHLPYVLGTRVVVWANRSGTDEEEKRDWWLESSNTSVLRIDSQSAGRAECTAVGAGEAEIRVHGRRDDNEVIHASTVSVQAPTTLRLFAHGPLLIGSPEGAAEVRQALVLEEGTATFLVRYFNGETLLYGNGVLEAAAQTSIDLAEETTFFLENREWLQVTPHSRGVHQVRLSASGHSLGTLEVNCVGAEEIAHIELLGENEDDAKKDDTLAVLALAYDAAERPIYGVSYDWDLDGQRENGEGDLYRYHYSAAQRRTLTARYDVHAAEAAINASDGWVTSSNTIGCSVGTAGTVPAAPVWLLAAALGLLLLRRRGRREP